MTLYIYVYIYIYIYVHTYIYRDTHTMEYYSAIKNEILLFVTSYMNLKESNLSEISHMEKDKYHVIIPLCGSKTIANKSNTH